MTQGIPYPVFDPVAFEIPFPYIGPLPIRWYALAYIAGLLIGWIYARALVKNDRLWGNVPHPSVVSIDDLLVYAAFGTILGGRLGDVFFYDFRIYRDAWLHGHYFEALQLWHGGMAFHGGLIGVAIGIFLFARKYKASMLVVCDICAAVVPIGLFFGRLANFIKPELWGRETTMPWGMVFIDPQTGLTLGDGLVRHPSQLYEAALEGIVLLVVLVIAIRKGALQRPGTVAGIFGIGYGLARIFVEQYRDPDPVSEKLGEWLTMGMVLSLPMILIGAALIWNANRNRARERELV
ncbi:prolipoprotein diacylglyceryl transferase [Methylovirgula sp. 4M-Z18]|uniref:prolipoprotein diacylglyceryl transferase n=1 Tax=Methylovirgula sp. 4M-Z18 TaxID=2293567 RepID=UPI000E2F2E93|nr:prolipoprotein diacylglyceryl transferase [Methylovirgula sp. 4M-Z18]RFB78382.1 prolipoprotein diacylglyceryl transferase [Methylovirgula sp. 4M-Z18]